MITYHTNAWLNEMKKKALPIYKMYVGVQLHFSSPSYSYPKYGGNTKVKSLPRGDNSIMISMNALSYAIESQEMEKYLVSTMFGQGYLHPSYLTARDQIYKWSNIKQRFSSREKFYDYCISSDDHNFVLNAAVDAVVRRIPSSDVAAMDAVSSCISSVDFCTISTLAFILQRLDEEVIQRIRDENVMYDLKISEIMKVKEFLEYWCLM